MSINGFPTVGRILHFVPSSADPLFNDGKPLAGIVADVNEDAGTVNLTVSGAHGTPVGVVDVPFVDVGAPVPAQSYATWPTHYMPTSPAAPDTTGGDGKSAAGKSADEQAESGQGEA